MLVGYAYCDISTLRRLNPKGIFLVQPGLYPDGSNGYGGMSVTYGSGLWHWGPGDTWLDGGCDKLPGGVNLGCMRPFSDAYDPLRNANGSVALVDTAPQEGRGGISQIRSARVRGSSSRSSSPTARSSTGYTRRAGTGSSPTTGSTGSSGKAGRTARTSTQIATARSTITRCCGSAGTTA